MAIGALRILYRDSSLVAVDKPSGFHVHKPEDPRIRFRETYNCLSILSRQLGAYVYPIHRLDFATSGVLLFALDKESAAHANRQFQERRVRKKYFCVVRGFVDEDLVIDRALANENDSAMLEASTQIRPLRQIELPRPVGRYQTARYTLLEAEPLTGRLHQIRRHLAGVSHPLIGDIRYGDRVHNRFFREDLGIQSLLLKAQLLELKHPLTDKALAIESKWTGRWHRVFDLFGLCPYLGTGRPFLLSARGSKINSSGNDVLEKMQQLQETDRV